MTAHTRMVSEWFAYVQPMYWPVLCLEIVRFWLFVWADAETHGVSRQMIIAVNDHGRIRVKYIEDAPEPEWRDLLSSHAAAVRQLTVSTPRDLIAGSSSVVAELLYWAPACAGESGGGRPILTRRPILDPG